ncbi:MAG TPA: SDR family NAD(P)-dependent oxidoreductase [Polyangiaceae bacterium]
MVARIDRVLITGASSGIGFDMAQRFLAAGSRVAINGRDTEKLARAQRALAHDDRVVAVPADVSKVDEARRLVSHALEALGGLDVLVNNAGIFAAKPLLQTAESDFDQLIATNLKGTYFVTQAAVPHLIAAGGGAVINLGAALAFQGKRRLSVSAVMASKGGVHALTVAWAAELAPHAIRVNTLAPGIIRTALAGDNPDARSGIVPLGRIGEVRDTSEAALYLARADFVTGTVLEVDGGYSHGR